MAGSTRSDITKGAVTVAVSATGASAWRKLDGVYKTFSMQSIPSTATTAMSMALQGTLTTASTTPTALVAITALTGAAGVSTGGVPVTHIRVNSTALSSGSVTNYIAALP